jgi:hypothetical protein
MRRGGRTRTCGAQFWRLPFWPLNYTPMNWKPPARAGVLGAVLEYPRHTRLRGHLLPVPGQHRLREGGFARSVHAVPGIHRESFR